VLTSQTHDRGFSIILVIGALSTISLLMVAALHLVQDHRRRSSLFADHALALQEAEAALAVAECELALATDTPSLGDCTPAPSAARITALNPINLAGFVRGHCGQDTPRRGLCWPAEGLSAQALAGLAGTTSSNAVPLPRTTTVSPRQPMRNARYIIEPIPDTQVGQWVDAGTPPSPWLFRITAVGFSADEHVNVLLQTVYRPRAIQP
jgi:Tfp pilus assembly protein PilX